MHINRILVLLVFISGCVSIPDTESMLAKMYNIPSKGESQFDGTMHVRMRNMICSNTIILEMYQDTKKASSGEVLVKAGTNEITNIGDGNSLLIKIDDEIRAFKSSSSITEHDRIQYDYGVNIPFSNKFYLIPEEFVRKMASSNILMVKMNLLNNSYVEGKCSAVTLEEYQQQNSHLGIKFTQKDIDTGNKASAQLGIKEFITLIDSESW